MTKFELAEMIGLRYEGPDNIRKLKWNFYIRGVNGNSFVDNNIITIFGWLPEEHDEEWAKNCAAEEFFDTICNKCFGVLE